MLRAPASPTSAARRATRRRVRASGGHGWPERASGDGARATPMPRSGQYWRSPERLDPVGTSVGRGGKGLVAPHRFRPATRAVRSGRRDRGLLEHSPTPAFSSPLAMTSPTRTFCNPGSARGSIRTLERPKLQPRKITNPSTNTPPPPYYPGEQKHLSPRARPLAGLPVCAVRPRTRSPRRVHPWFPPAGICSAKSAGLPSATSSGRCAPAAVWWCRLPSSRHKPRAVPTARPRGTAPSGSDPRLVPRNAPWAGRGRLRRLFPVRGRRPIF